MRLTANQPFFFPYITYLQLIKAGEVFLIADDFSYTPQAWINRNRILMNGKDFLFNLSVIGGSQNKLINEVYVAEEQYKLLKTIEICYRKAPFFRDFFPIVEDIFRHENKNLAKFVSNSLIQIANYLHFDTKFIVSSEVDGLNRSLKAQERVIDFCTVLGATEYINIQVEGLYDKKDFLKKGIDLYFLKTKPITYKQYSEPFVPNLSMLDVLMFNSIEQTNELLMQYELV